VAEPGRQSNTSTLLLGHARDEIVAAISKCTPEMVESTISNGLEQRLLDFTYGHIEGQLPPGVTDVAAHLFDQRTADEKLEYDWVNSSIIRTGPGYTYTLRNVRVERIELMTWCRKDNLLLPEELLAPPFKLSPEFARPALTQRHVLQAESFSVGALDFATPVLTVRPGPGQEVPPEAPESVPSSPAIDDASVVSERAPTPTNAKHSAKRWVEQMIDVPLPEDFAGSRPEYLFHQQPVPGKWTRHYLETLLSEVRRERKATIPGKPPKKDFPK
jgi:hypothetical protein